MPSYRKPQLPDPGHDRWWEIASDRFGDFILTLKRYPESYYAEDVVVAEERVRGSGATAHEFEKMARSMLETADKINAFTGVYNRTEENN